jgi:hypothetical protein
MVLPELPLRPTKAAQGMKEVFGQTFDWASRNRRPIWKDYGSGTYKAIDPNVYDARTGEYVNEIVDVPYAAPAIYKPGEALGYAGARLAADWTTDATRSKWWRINAAQAMSNEIGQGLAERAGLNPRDALLAGMGLTTVMELASGNVNPMNLGEAGRPAGYQSLFPKTVEAINPTTGEIEYQEDFRKSNNPIAELGARYFLGRTGRLLPRDQFFEERPDVSPEEYERFQAAKRRNTLFGWENLPREATTVGGAIVGGTLGAITRKPIQGLVSGTIAGNLMPNASNVVSELGLVQGTRDSIDDPVGEIEVLGYRLPLLKGLGGTAAVGALGYAGLKLKRAGAFDGLAQRAGQMGGLLP